MPRRQRNVPLAEEDAPQRKASTGTIRSEGGLRHYSKAGIWHIHDSTDSLQVPQQGSSMRTKHTSGGSQDGSSRFPKLEECAHFHYDIVDFGSLQVTLCEEDRENYRHNEVEPGERAVLVRVSCNNKSWNVRRTLSHFRSLDRQLHRCIFDRKFSQLPELHSANTDAKTSKEVEYLLHTYLKRFSELAGSMINCGSILNWLEMDNRGNRLLAVDDSGINTPAIAAAHAVKRYNAQAADEISLQVGDIVSVIDMPPAEDTIWWRGKRGFEVGFFPYECVEVITDKVPPSMAQCIPASSLSTSPGSTLTPLTTPATARKPLMRKHGKLMSFLRTFFSTRPARNQLKQSGIVKERVFGCDLGEHLLNSGHDVPLVLKSCSEVIERHGIVDGIYRLSGITSNIQKLRVAFDEDQVPELMESTYLQDIHSISSLLKMYFRELPNPLLTYQLYDKFAEAVRDEDNKLLRIHDVVQQLPPPHYRTLEYLMRHLGRVASHAVDTGMHSKNLAIVWAPNLLRSKELELGGGAAALQGVGIQAVVTECLICYCDIIFSDKMPSYGSPHLQRSQRKPRPKSLAISTPTRLLTLEEARERAFIGSLAHSQRFIDVGGGPASLPATYHTVIDLPGYRKKSNKDGSSSKGKKSPVTGWKSIFSKPRAGSVKKTRKASIPGDDKPLESLQARALTEEDVHNWKRRLRSAKSAESLLSMTTSSRSSTSSHTSSAFTTDSHRIRDDFMPFHKRSLSSDTSVIMHHHHHHLPPQHNAVGSTKDVPNDVRLEGASSPPPSSNRSKPDRRSEQNPRRQSFVRGDSTRKALHRRTPSAPNTPRMDRAAAGAVVNGQHKASSQPRLDSLPASPQSDASLLSTPTTDTSLGIDIDAAIKARLTQMAYASRSARSSDSSPRSPEKLPPGGARRESDGDRGQAEMGNGVLTLQESPGSHRKPVSPPLQTKFFVSRYHDYAEILSDDEKDSKSSKLSTPSSTSDMQELVDKLDSKLSSTATRFYLPDTSSDAPDTQVGSTNTSDIVQAASNEVPSHVSSRTVERVPASTVAVDSPPPSTQVVRRRAEFIPSESTLGSDSFGRPVEFPELIPRLPGHREAILSPTAQVRARQEARQGVRGEGAAGQGGMTKCLSVPSDIARSLENITGSQCDLLSSVTISELSQSVNSFGPGAQDDSPMREDPRWRRSTSLDSLEAESSMCRTLRAINAQMDSAFHQKVDRALELEEEGYSRHIDSDEASSLSPLHISEDNLTPTVIQETHFPAIVDIDTALQNRSELESTSESPAPECVLDAPLSCPVTDIDGDVDLLPQYEAQSSQRMKVLSGSDSSRTPQQGSLEYIPCEQVEDYCSNPSDRDHRDTTGRWEQRFLVSGGSMDTATFPPYTRSGREVTRVKQTAQEADTSRNGPVGVAPLEGRGSVLPRGVAPPSVVRRPSSSSCSTSSSDVDEESDDSIEIVHHAQPADSQYAMKLHSKQRAAESFPQRAAESFPQRAPESLPSAGRARSESLPDSWMAKSRPQPLDSVRRDSDFPPDLRQFSPDDVMWRQSPLFSPSSKVDFSSDPEVTSRHGRHAGLGSEQTPADNARRQGASQGYNPESAAAPHQSGQTHSGKKSARPEARHPHASPAQDRRPRLGSQPERSQIPTSPSKRQAEYRGHSLDGTLAAEGLLSTDPHHPLSSQPPCSTVWPQSDLPIISGNVHSRAEAQPVSPASYPRSPPPPREAPDTRRDAAAANLPLHLMLYHPDEFKVPTAAAGTPSASCLQPQVHVAHDTLTEEKAVIKKGASQQPSEAGLPSTRVQEAVLPSARVQEMADEPTQKAWQSLLSEAESFEGVSGRGVDIGTGGGGGMVLGRAEQDAMEVDNLCNKLVDELHCARRRQPSPPTSPKQRLASDTQCRDATSFQELSRDRGAAVAASPRGTVQVEAVVERRVEGAAGMGGGEAVMEQRMLRVESFGEVEDEELQNVVNTGKEMLLAHAPAATAITTTITTTISTTHPTSSSPSTHSSSSPQHPKPTHERRLSASKIPRFHKRSDSREEKQSVCDTLVITADVQQTVSASAPSSSPAQEGRSPSSATKPKDCDQSRIPASHRGSKIPLSQKIPSPTSSFRESSQKLPRPVTSPPSPRPPTSHSSKSQHSKPPHNQHPVPKSRTSLHKSDVPPPAEEVVEVTRPSVKKRTSLNQGRGERTGSGREAGRGEKKVIVKELRMEKGDAKLIIEKQPSLKKKIQTVHARKVPHPPRQIAEALDPDSCDSPPADLSSTGPSDMEHSGMSSQEDEVFSDESLRLGFGRQDGSFSSSTRGQLGNAPPSPMLNHRAQQGDSYSQMTASRSSLDDSALQLAAERHDTFVPSWEGSEGGGYSTGSLRTRRSLKMQNLMEMFEKVSTSNSSEDSSESTRHKERSDSNSGSTTISACSQDREPDTDDDIFHPPCARLPASILARRSRSRERASRGVGQPSPSRGPSHSPSSRRTASASSRDREHILRQRRASPASRITSDERPRVSGRSETGVGLGRPPPYRSASRGRTYSDSSTSESDTHYQDIGSNVGRQRSLAKTRLEIVEDGLSRKECVDSLSGREDGGEGVQRRGSIKELRQLFEKGAGGDSQDSGNEPSPPVPVRRSTRTRSVSPAADSTSPAAMANAMRRSLEIPSSSSMLGQQDQRLIAQPVRLGPKPFYGSKK